MNDLEQITLDKPMTNDEIQRYLFRLVEELNYKILDTQEIKDVSAGSTIPVPTPEPTPLDFDAIYPVGSIYMSVNSTSPQTLFGGTWERIQDKFLLSAGSTYSAGATGGEATHTLTTEEMPEHRHTHKAHFQWHSGSTNTLQVGGTSINVASQYGYAHIDTAQVDTYSAYVGGGQTHNNMPPYLVVYVWKRTA